jgi:sugar phosphate isomerase/epimerase
VPQIRPDGGGGRYEINNTMKKNQLAAQLYTCREITKTPFEISRTLRRVREAGYTAVQASGLGPIADDELIRMLDGEGLTCCATHEPGALILKEPQRVVERLARLRCKFTAYPFPSGINLSDPAALHGLIENLEESGAVLAASGMTLCYHNHHQEFRKTGGATILEKIYSSTSARHLQGELDTYWVQYGGGDPAAWCERLSGRLPLIHLKDYMVNDENEPAYCEIGSGNLDFARIVAAAEKAGCQYFIVEQDETPGDPVDSLAQSFRHLAENICKE